jgi:hypothetical protein
MAGAAADVAAELAPVVAGVAVVAAEVAGATADVAVAVAAEDGADSEPVVAGVADLVPGPLVPVAAEVAVGVVGAAIVVAAEVAGAAAEATAGVTGAATTEVAADVAESTVDATAIGDEVDGGALDCGRVAACACRENNSKTAAVPAAKIATCTARRAMWRNISCGIEQLPLRRERPDQPGVPVVSDSKPRVQDYFGAAVPESDITVCSATTVQHRLRPRKRLFAADENQAVRRLAGRAGLPADLVRYLGPRTLRHTFAALYLEVGGAGHFPANRVLRPGSVLPRHPAHRALDQGLGSRPHCRAQRLQRAIRDPRPAARLRLLATCEAILFCANAFT